MKNFSVHWENYYSKNKSPNKPSNFAKYCKKYFLKKNNNLLEIGSGNGRDTIFFCKYLRSVTSIDSSVNALKLINSVKDKKKINNLKLYSYDVSKINQLILPKNNFDFVYMRWFLHAITEKKQDLLFYHLSKIKGKKPLIAIEARTSYDKIQKSRNLKKISDFEFVSQGNHYRRLLDVKIFCNQINDLGFKILYKRVATNFSKIKVSNSNEKPSLLRMLIIKK